VAGASFGVAMSLGSGSFPPRYKGLAMGIVGAGNVGTAFAAAGPVLAQNFGWQTVYGIAALSVAIPAAVMVVFAKEPADLSPHTALREHLSACTKKTAGPSA
jgi:NNP family nitrate/nitrite transporter-like MFS transporter